MLTTSRRRIQRRNEGRNSAIWFSLVNSQLLTAKIQLVRIRLSMDSLHCSGLELLYVSTTLHVPIPIHVLRNGYDLCCKRIPKLGLCLMLQKVSACE